MKKFYVTFLLSMIGLGAAMVGWDPKPASK